jgi:hypothetical protein
MHIVKYSEDRSVYQASRHPLKDEHIAALRDRNMGDPTPHESHTVTIAGSGSDGFRQVKDRVPVNRIDSTGSGVRRKERERAKTRPDLEHAISRLDNCVDGALKRLNALLLP